MTNDRTGRKETNESYKPTKAEVKAYVEEIIQYWLSWASKRAGPGLGYKNRVTWLSAPGKGHSRGVPLFESGDELALSIERIILDLPELEKDTLLVHYLERGTAVHKAGRLHVSVATLYARLDRAHVYLYQAFSRLAGGKS